MRPSIVFFLAFPVSIAIAAVPVVETGRPVAKIFLSHKPELLPEAGPSPRPLETAVNELNYHIEKITGARLEVVEAESPSEIKGAAIVLGRLAHDAGAVLAPTPDRDSFRLLAKDSQILISGETDEATLNGVYGLLNRLGCEWVMPGAIGEVTPKMADVSVSDLDVTEKPSFAIRNLWYHGTRKLNTPQEVEEFNIWKRRQRMTGWPADTFGEGHAWSGFIKKHKDEFQKDPTMFALIRGTDGNLVRKGPQLESTHPRVIELFAQDIKETFEKNHWPKDKAVGFSIGPSDGLGFSTSPESEAAGSGRIDPLLGLPDSTDLIVLLGNQILERIGKEYPNLTLGYYCYSTHADYPLKYKPDPRLNIIFAPISSSRFHSVFDKNSKTWPYYRQVVEEWAKVAKVQGNRLVYRGYNYNLAENMMPFSKLRILGDEIPWYKENHVTAFNIEATKAWAVNGPHDFLMAKLLWNSTSNWKDVVHSYCQASFGKGGDAMENYFLSLTDRQHGAGGEAGSYFSFPHIYDAEFVDAGKHLITSAIAQAESPDEKMRAGFFLYPLDELGLFLQFHQSCTQFDFARAALLYRQILDNWQKAYDLNSSIVAKEVPQYLKRFLEKFVEDAAKYSAAPYQIVYRIPDALPMMLDPNNVGERLNYQGKEINDSQFIRTRTWSTTWDAQGLGAFHTGSVWYRIWFELPPEFKGKPLGLFLGGVDDEAQVWLNGKFIGSGRKFSMPFVFDLTDALETGGKNLLAIKVLRNSTINEIGIGGILRPSFLFAGPRLEQKSPPSTEPDTRVLPGGGVESAGVQ